MTKIEEVEKELALLQAQVKEKEQTLKELKDKQILCEYCKKEITANFLNAYVVDREYDYCNSNCLTHDLINEGIAKEVEYD